MSYQLTTGDNSGESLYTKENRLRKSIDMLGEANDEQLYAADRITTETKCYTAHGTDCYCHCRFCFVLLFFGWFRLFHCYFTSVPIHDLNSGRGRTTQKKLEMHKSWMPSECVYFSISSVAILAVKRENARARAHTHPTYTMRM